jgi:hypothetical protein
MCKMIAVSGEVKEAAKEKPVKGALKKKWAEGVRAARLEIGRVKAQAII